MPKDIGNRCRDQGYALRPARKSDCAVIARLYSIFSDGVADYIWRKLADPAENFLDVGRRRYEREETLFSYRNCTVVEIDEEIAGMLVAFPMHVEPSATENDPVLAPYSEHEEDKSYYICGMARGDLSTPADSIYRRCDPDGETLA